MLITKSHKIPLITNNKTNQMFISWCGTARWAYNYGLERKINVFKENRVSVGNYNVMKEIVALKKCEEYSWLKDIPKSVPRMALMHLEKAYANFFKRVKDNKKEKGFPKFKSKKLSRMCFHLEPDSIVVDGNKVRIPKIGFVKMYQKIRFEGKLVDTVCIGKTAGRWYASFAVKTEVSSQIEKQDKIAVGLDVGVKMLATLSDGKKFDNPRAFYKLGKLLARTQRQMERKQKGSTRRERAKLRVQLIHKRIADLRANATHHVSSYVAKNYTGAAIEDLNVKGMVCNHNLAKSILDANMSELHRQLIYKMDWAGGEVRQVDRFFPSSKLCSNCGYINDKLALADRDWICECGIKHDRDINAAINLAIKCYGPTVGGSWTLRVKP